MRNRLGGGGGGSGGGRGKSFGSNTGNVRTSHSFDGENPGTLLFDLTHNNNLTSGLSKNGVTVKDGNDDEDAEDAPVRGVSRRGSDLMHHNGAKGKVLVGAVSSSVPTSTSSSIITARKRSDTPPRSLSPKQRKRRGYVYAIDYLPYTFIHLHFVVL